MPAQLILAQVPLPADLLGPESVTTVAARTCLLEGPAFDGDGNLFSATSSAITSTGWRPDGALSIFRADSGRTNGNTFDAHGLADQL